jgi:hypothetical protein
MMPTVVDETIDLWTKMLEADQVHDEKIVKNVETMQTSADAAVFAFLLRLLELFPPSRTHPASPLILPRSLALDRSLSRARSLCLLPSVTVCSVRIHLVSVCMLACACAYACACACEHPCQCCRSTSGTEGIKKRGDTLNSRSEGVRVNNWYSIQCNE